MVDDLDLASNAVTLALALGSSLLLFIAVVRLLIAATRESMVGTV